MLSATQTALDLLQSCVAHRPLAASSNNLATLLTLYDLPSFALRPSFFLSVTASTVLTDVINLDDDVSSVIVREFDSDPSTASQLMDHASGREQRSTKGRE